MPHESYKIVKFGWYLTSSTTNHNWNLIIKHREPRTKYCNEGAPSYCFHGLILKLDIDIRSLKVQKTVLPIIKVAVSVFHFNSSS